MYGVKKPIEAMQTATGVKDKVAEHWIQLLLKKAKELQNTNPGRSHESIAEELRLWFKEQPGDKINPLLSMPGKQGSGFLIQALIFLNLPGLDPTQDTPVEILHTFLLGIVKYVWYILHSSWTNPQKDLFVIRLQSTDVSGLNIPSIRGAYMMQYKNNLIGKHFKTLSQTLAFHVYDLVTVEQFTLVKASGMLGAMLWVPEIDNMEQYLVSATLLPEMRGY